MRNRIDLDCTHKETGEVIIVQCKKHKGKIGSPVVRDFYGSFVRSQANREYIVTTSGFTSDVKIWENGKPIELIDRKKLMKMMG